MLYHYELDNGDRHTIDCQCAGDAVQVAIDRHRLHRVKLCWLGDDKAGRIDYEVPSHDPMPKRVRVPKKKPPQMGMFSDALIKSESKRAIVRTNPQAEG